MAKVNKTYSLDIETIQMIEEYTMRGTTSRSRLVNNAIRWYISGDGQDIAELHEEIVFLKKVISDPERVRPGTKPRVWWKRLLGLN